MSGENLGNKQTIILHNCIINDERYELIITSHRQTIGYIRTKRQTLRKKILTNKNKTLGNDFQIRNKRNTKTPQFKRLNK